MIFCTSSDHFFINWILLYPHTPHQPPPKPLNTSPASFSGYPLHLPRTQNAYKTAENKGFLDMFPLYPHHTFCVRRLRKHIHWLHLFQLIQLFGISEQLKKREMLVNVVLWYFTILLRLAKS